MKKNLKILLSLIIMFAFFILISNVYAASASISTSSTSIKKGETANITVAVQSAEAWNLSVSKSGGSLSGNTASAESAGHEVSQTVITNTFTSEKEGTYTITLSGQITGNDLQAINVSKSITIAVTNPTPETPPATDPEPVTPPSTDPEPQTPPAEPTKSSDADLRNLGIEPNDFRGFTANQTIYDFTVPKNVDTVKVYAYASSDKATIEGVGNKALEIGKNVLEVTVTAEDGTKKVYTMNITRTEKEEEKSTNSKLRSVTITPTGLTPDFDKDKNEYTLKVGNDIEEIKISATKDDNKSKYEVIGNTSLKEGENEVKIVVTAEDGSTNTYIIKVTREPKEVFGLKELSLLGITKERKNIEMYLSPDFKADVTEYICKLQENVANVSVTSIASKEDANVEILGDKELEIGENTITIIVKSADGKETKTYQIVITNPSVEETLTTGITNSITNGESDNDDMKKVIYIVCVVLIALMGITYAVIEYRHRKNRKSGKEEIDYDYDFVEDYVNKNPESVSEVNKFSKAFLEGLEKDKLTEDKYNVEEQEDDDESDEFTYKPDNSFEDDNSFDDYENDEDDDNSHRGRKTGRRFK